MWINSCLWGILGLCHLGGVVMSFSIFSLFSFPLWICLRSVVFFYFFISLLQWKMRGLLYLRSVSSFDFFNSLLLWKVSGPFYPRCLKWIQDIIFSFIFSYFLNSQIKIGLHLQSFVTVMSFLLVRCTGTMPHGSVFTVFCCFKFIIYAYAV